MSKVFSSFRWLLGTQILRKALLLVLFVVLARAVPKSAFGMFGEYTQILALLTLLASMSLEYLHIVERKHNDSLFSALLGVSLTNAVLLGILLFIAAPWIALLFHAPSLSTVIRVTLPIFLVHQVRKAYKNQLQREMRFRQIAFYETVNVVSYVIISFVWLTIDHSIWIVFIPFFIGDVLETALLVNRHDLLSALRNALGRLRTHFRVLYQARRFCFAATFTNVMNVFGSSAPMLILGAFLAPERIGVYYIAWQITALPLGLATDSMQRVFFPALAASAPEVRKTQVERFVFFVGTLVWLGIAAYAFAAMRLIPPIFGAKWAEVPSLIPALAIFVAGNILANPLSSIPMVVKRPQVEMMWTIVSLLLRCVWLGLGGWKCAHGEWSLSFVIMGYGILGFLLYLALFVIVLNLIDVPIRPILRRLLPAFGVQLVGIALYFVTGARFSFWGVFLPVLFVPVGYWLIDRFSGGVLRTEAGSIVGLRREED